MTPVQFGWTLPAGPHSAEARATFLADVRRALELVDGRFDSAWVIDHFQLKEGHDILECWTTLTYLAALYPSLQFGTGVLGQSYRNPALTAKMAATLQYLSGGRLLFGIGAGWKEDEYLAYGYDFPPNGVRVEQLDEAVRIIKALWSEECATLQGRYYHVEQAACEPRPQPVPPMIIGGTKPRMLRLVARHADWWNVSWTGIGATESRPRSWSAPAPRSGATRPRYGGPGSGRAPAPRPRRRLGSWRPGASPPKKGSWGRPSRWPSRCRHLSSWESTIS